MTPKEISVAGINQPTNVSVGNGHIDQATIVTDVVIRNPLVTTVFEAAKEKGETMEKIPLIEWYDKVASGEITVTRNAHDTVYKSIVSVGESQLPSGYTDYAAFSKRQDDYAVLGLHRTKEVLMRYLKMGKGNGGRNLFLVFVGPSGGGKSSMTDVLKQIVESYTQTNPLFAIEGCKNRCDPVAILDNIPTLTPSTRDALREKGLDTTCKLCPDCKQRLAEEKYDLTKFSVRPFALTSGNGISKLEPDDTRSEIARRSIVKRKQRAAHRGTLEVAELRKHQDFLHLINDFVNGRKMQDEQGREFEVDCVVIAHTTDEEWRQIEADKNLTSFRKRMQIIRVPYILTRSDEVKVYEKFLRDSERPVYAKWSEAVGENAVHIPPLTLKTLAEVAIQTRLIDMTAPGIPKRIAACAKVDLYDGEHVEDFTQQHVRTFQEEGEKINEGFIGVSPRDMRTFLGHMVSNAERCLDPLQALLDIATSPYAKETPGIFGEMRFSNKISSARQKYEREMAQMVLRAFRPDFEEACATQLKAYLEEAEYYAQGRNAQVRLDSRGEVIGPDEKFLRRVEDQAGISEIAKKTFREQAATKTFSLTRKGESVTMEGLEKIGLGDIKSAIEEIVFGEKGRPEDLLEKLANALVEGQDKHMNDPVKREKLLEKLDKETRGKLEGVVQRLTKDYSCCPDCAWKQMTYLGRNLHLVRKASSKK